MPNKTSGGKSGGGQSVQWNPSPTHQMTPETWTFSKGKWAPAPTGTQSTFGGMQTVGAQPAAQLPAGVHTPTAQTGLPAAQTPGQPPVMPVPQAPQAPQMPSADMQARFNGLNPLVKWLFAQRAASQGLGGPMMAYQNFWNRHHQ